MDKAMKEKELKEMHASVRTTSGVGIAEALREEKIRLNFPLGAWEVVFLWIEQPGSVCLLSVMWRNDRPREAPR